MASHRVGETGLSDSGPTNHHVPYAIFHGINAPSTSFLYVKQSLFFHCSIKKFLLRHTKFKMISLMGLLLFIVFPNWIGLVCFFGHV